MKADKTNNNKNRENCTNEGVKQNARKRRGSNRKSVKSKDVTRPVERDNGRASNDVAWYAHNPALLKASGSIPFSAVLGQDLGFKGRPNLQPVRVPGIMSLAWTPALGGILESTSIVDQSAASMYSFLVHANSRNYTYEQSDLMMLVLAGASLFSTLAHVIRAYGVAMYYKEQNFYTPKSLLESMGFIAEDFTRNLGKIWFDINQLIAQTQQIWIPNTIPLIQRWFWLNSNVFMDANDIKGQMYLFVPDHLYKYHETLTKNGGGVVNTQFSVAGTTNTWASWVEAIQEQIDALVDSEDRGIIFGDILNAYGKDKIYAIPQIPADYRVEPVYNPEVLSQIENATICGDYLGAIYQKNNRIYQARGPLTTIQDSQNWTPLTPVLNVHIEGQPTPEAIMVATRFQSLGMRYMAKCPVVTTDGETGEINGISESVSGMMPTSCGSERITAVRIYTDPYYTEGTGFKMVEQYDAVDDIGETIPTVWGHIQAFDWHPFMYLVRNTSSTSWVESSEVIDAFGDYANYVTMNTLMSSKLHSTALMSLFGVPQV